MRRILNLKIGKFNIAVTILVAAILVGCVGVNGKPINTVVPYTNGFMEGCFDTISFFTAPDSPPHEQIVNMCWTIKGIHDQMADEIQEGEVICEGNCI